MNKHSFLILICILWLLGTINSRTIENNVEERLISDVPQTEDFLTRNSIEEKTNEHLLIEQWQEYILANALVANYLNILIVLASRSDFSLTNTSNQCAKYIRNPNSFRETISQLADNIRFVLINVFEDLNRIYIGLDRIPLHLKTIFLLLKKGSKVSMNTNLPNLLKKGENLVNQSLIILKNPQAKFEQVKDLLNELDFLTSDNAIKLQIEDVKTQWILLTDLFTQLAIQAEKTSNNFLLQFNWIFEQFIQLDIDNYRDLIITLLKSKVIEIDRTIDLLTIISQTYMDISLNYTNAKMTDNTHLIFLSNEQERKETIKQYRYELQTQVVRIARLALKRHDEFLQRNQNRQIVHDNFSNEMSQNDLNILLSLD